MAGNLYPQDGRCREIRLCSFIPNSSWRYEMPPSAIYIKIWLTVQCLLRGVSSEIALPNIHCCTRLQQKCLMSKQSTGNHRWYFYQWVSGEILKLDNLTCASVIRPSTLINSGHNSSRLETVSAVSWASFNVVSVVFNWACKPSLVQSGHAVNERT